MPIIGDLIPAAATADTFRIVSLSQGGRPVAVLNLEDGAYYMKERGSFVVTAPPAKPKTVNLSSRWGGNRVVGETHDNAAVGATWRVKGLSADQCIQNVEALLAQVTEDARGRFLEWRPFGASRSVLFEIRGPGTWQAKYQWVDFSQTQSMSFDIQWPVAPLGTLLPMDIFDDFAVDSIGDYSFDAGAGTLAVSGGRLVPSSTVEKRIRHVGRGYSYTDVQVTAKVTTGAATAGIRFGPRLKILDDSNYLRLTADGTNLVIVKVDGGATTTVATTAFALSASTAYWVRGRIEGNVVYIEGFTSQPSPSVAPAASTSYTLAGADATKFGAGVSGQVGLRIIPAGTDERYNEFEVWPYTYGNVVWPDTRQLGGQIPGDAPALCDLYLDTSDSIYFGLLGWTPRPATPLGGTVAPFGIIEAETAGNLSGWTAGTGATARGGNMLKDTSPASSTTYTAMWPIDLSTLTAEDFANNVLVLEVFARVRLDSQLVSPKLTLSLRPSAFLSQVVAYTTEYGSAGKLLTVPSADAWKPVRLGTLVVRPADFAQPSYRLRIDGSLGAGTAGTEWGIDFLTVVSARSRVAGPTGKTADSTYPQLVPYTPLRRIIRSNGSGEAGSSKDARFPAPSLNGTIELPPGNVDVVGRFSDLVPDDPTASSTSESLSRTASIHLGVTPRVFLAGSP